MDLLRFLAGAPIASWSALPIGDSPGVAVRDDKVSVTLRFSNGSLGCLQYLANGNKSFPKERLDVFCAGRVLELGNFKKLTGYGWPSFQRMTLWRQDKGNRACAAAFVAAVRDAHPSPIPFEELMEVSHASTEIEKWLAGS